MPELLAIQRPSSELMELLEYLDEAQVRGEPPIYHPRDIWVLKRYIEYLEEALRGAGDRIAELEQQPATGPQHFEEGHSDMNKPELTEDSPEVVLAAAGRQQSADDTLADFRNWPATISDWTRVVEAARKLHAEGKLGPAPSVEAFRAKVLRYLDRAAGDAERLARETGDNIYGERAYAFRLAHSAVERTRKRKRALPTREGRE